MDKETGIWTIEEAKTKHRFDPYLPPAISELYSPKKMADVGCGDGRYCNVFKEHGWSVVHGYEGTPNIKSLGVYDDIMIVDLTKRRWVGIDYDLVICLEVGEHIPRKHEQVFIDNVCEFASKDLILSWAVPGQGGTGHFNEQPNDYVIEQFYKRKFKIDRRKTKYLRGFASLKWFRNTLMVFYR